MKRIALAIMCCLLSSILLAQQNRSAAAARAWRQNHEQAIMAEFASLLRIPNVSRDRQNIQRNADAIVGMLTERGIAARLVSIPGSNPVVFGEIQAPGASRTIAFYAHYDGQPLDPAEWASPPFEPTLRDKPVEDGGQAIPFPAPGTPFNPEWRLYARGAGDDKAPIIALLVAVDAIRASKLPLRSNIKFVFDGEEEIGSPNLEGILAANRELFAADVWLMCDAPLYQTRQQLILFGARGLTTFDVTVYGARGELHSGHYGNWAPNPAMSLARLLTSMKDDNGHVTIQGFYDDVEPLTDEDRRALDEAPVLDAALLREFWLGGSEGSPKTLNELITLPSFNVRGMSSGRTGGEASNVIPATATATLDIRLVKGMDIERTRQRVLDHVRKQGFFVVETEPNADVRRAHPKLAKVTFARGSTASRTSMSLPISQEVIRAVEAVRGRTVKLPTMGGNLPLGQVERPLGTRTIVIPIANHDDNQHTFNENLRIQNLWDGIEVMAALLTM
jgi:acetylornithine deacetylase/succinyl-diaminopimelate desuccinylase-like protein